MTALSASCHRPVGSASYSEVASVTSDEHSVFPLARESLSPGDVIAGKYRVRGELGRGGFAVVYDAEHLGLQQAVALKVLHRSNGTPSVLLERFAREVRISALVRHPHVLQVHDVGVLSDGSPFLVMEKIQGETLHHYLCLAGRLSLEQTIELTRQLLSALVALASRGIVHRDIKPENLMLTTTDSGDLLLKLVDFGIALVGSEQISASRLTRHGALVGTPHYMAPEQLRSEVVDARVDIYATGVVMYQALTGSMPFDGEDLGALALNVLHGNARRVRSLRPDCPPQLAAIVDRALAREPDRRFPSAATMLAALNDVALDQGAWEVAWGSLWPSSWQRRTPRVALSVAVLAGSLLWTPWFLGPSRVERPRAQVPVPSPIAAGQVTLTQLDAQQAEPEVRQLFEIAPIEPLTVIASSTGPSASSPRAADQARALALGRKALASYLHGEVAEAYSAYRKAVQLDPSDPSLFRGLGLSAGRLGKAHEARRAYARYLELSPRAADAELVKARLVELGVAARRP
jgi:serine/threonine protein kinase